MKANINGFEAVEDGLRAGGVERFLCNVVREPLCNAEKAICKGSFFAASHHKTACIISEKDIDALQYLSEKKEIQNSGFEIIILGRELNSSILKKLHAFAIPLMVAENINDVRGMVTDGIAYSELWMTPVAVFVPTVLLRSRAPVTLDGRYYCDEWWKISEAERMLRKPEMEKHYNRIFGIQHSKVQPQCLIIAMPGTAGIVREIVGSQAGIYICKMNLFSTDMHADNIEKYKKILLIGHGSEHIKNMLAEKKVPERMITAYELSSDKLHETFEVANALKEYIPHVSRFTDEIPRVSRPSEEFLTNKMCRGCPYIDAIKGIISQSSDTSVYEDIYCEKRGTAVRSGLTCASSAYAGRLVVTNRRDIHFTNLQVRYIDCQCNKLK